MHLYLDPIHTHLFSSNAFHIHMLFLTSKKTQCSLNPLHAACMGMGMGPSTRARVVSQWLHL